METIAEIRKKVARNNFEAVFLQALDAYNAHSPAWMAEEHDPDDPYRYQPPPVDSETEKITVEQLLETVGTIYREDDDFGDEKLGGLYHNLIEKAFLLHVQNTEGDAAALMTKLRLVR